MCMCAWSLFFFLQSHQYLMRVPTLMTLSNPNHYPKAPPPNTMAWFFFPLKNSQWD
jgi:hypothetical protein